MLKKERWIVYPLLMLSLFSSLVGVQVIKAQQEVMDFLTVRSLSVVDEKGQPITVIGPGMNGGGMISVFDENGDFGIVMAAESDFRGVVVAKPNGDLGMVMGSDESGGMIEGYGKEDTLALRITPSMLTYYTNYITGARMVGSELSRNGLKVEGLTSANYKSDGISYNGVMGFKLPRNITN